MYKITLLSASVSLSKSFTLVKGTLEKSPYPNISNFTSTEHTLDSLIELAPILSIAASAGQCLLKGNLNRELKNESRAGSTNSQDSTTIVCFDLDGLKNSTRDVTVEEFMSAVGLPNVSYVVQYSASMGVDTGRGLSAHIFCALSTPVAAPFLKQWLIGLNLNTPLLRAQIELNRIGTAIRWPLDITTCQNDKLIYIANPTLGPGIKDKFVGKRIEYIAKEQDVIPSNTITADPQKNRTETKEIISDLRKLAGYPAIRDSQYKMKGSTPYMAKPGDAIVTGMKVDRGFVYFNLNGGDSWAYYHPEDQPEFIFNFKGEPTYLTNELLPEYYASLTERKRVEHAGKIFFVVRDFKTDRFYNGSYEEETNTLVMARAQTETRLKSFMKQHGQPVPDFIPDWDLQYNPSCITRYNEDIKVINTFQPSEFENLPPQTLHQCPRTILRVLEHVIGKGEILSHFLNWFAYIVQLKRATGTAWVLHGDQGTGKGVTFHRILTPCLGISNTHSMLASGLESQFNSHFETSLLIFVDEAQLSSSANWRQVNACVKNAICEPRLTIRRMHTDTYTVPNYSNMIFASNQPDPVIIEPTDRRFNVATFQPERLVLTEEDLANIDREVVDFFHYIKSLVVDEVAARTVMQTEARSQLMNIARSSVDEVADNLLGGNLEYFFDQLPSSSDPVFNTIQSSSFRALLIQILMSGAGPYAISRDEIFLIYDYCVGNTPRSPNKFTAMLRHHRIHTHRVRRGKESFYGLMIPWIQPQAWFDAKKEEFLTPIDRKIVNIKKAAS